MLTIRYSADRGVQRCSGRVSVILDMHQDQYSRYILPGNAAGVMVDD